jgi:predicted ATPase
MDLGDITILVGGNNAGKSTVVKAILLITEFLKTRMIVNEEDESAILNNRFYFDKNYYAHIGTVSRAIYNMAKDKEMEFYVNFGDGSINIKLYKDDDDVNSTNAYIREIEMKDLNRGIDYFLDFTKNLLKVQFQPKPVEEQINEERIETEKELKELRAQKRKENNLAKKAELDDKIRDLESYMRYIKKQNKTISEPRIIETTITGYRGMVGGPLLETLLYRLVGLSEYFESDGSVKLKKKDIQKNFNLSKEDIAFLIQYEEPLFNSIGIFDGFTFYMRRYEYIYAHSANQMIIYNSKDSNDYLVKTIHEFANMRIKSGESANRFIKEWMQKFEIGIDYRLRSVGGEAHTIEIKDDKNNYVYLADKGMGSIQLMILLLRLATFIGNKKSMPRGKDVTIMVEEPELNLHPKLQSNLIDLFVYLNKKYGFKFIIETHSEYLVRKSQVIVGDQNYKTIDELKKNNPFKVYYFPENGNPYEMEYTLSGLFENDFDTGFFDEATKHQLKLLQNKRRNNNV